MNRRNTPRISFIGFGEAGQAIASGLRDAGVERIAAWDILFPEQAGAPLKAASEATGVRAAASAADAVREATERFVTRGSRAGLERVLQRFHRSDRGIAIYDEFGIVI